jgi:anti-sigma factor ChrR (cupin superfamily)
MTERALLPQFIREAFEDERVDEPAALGTLFSLEAVLEGVLQPALQHAALQHAALQHAALQHAALHEATPRPHVLERLELALSEPPHRYAPFFGRAAELFDLPESAVIAQLTRLKDPNVWMFAGLPGISSVRVDAGPGVREAETLFVRFNPGARFPLHRHVGLERVLVLEGSYQDNTGVLHRAGELREWPSDTEHSFRVGDETCIFASVVFGRRFSSWPLRALASVLGH